MPHDRVQSSYSTPLGGLPASASRELGGNPSANRGAITSNRPYVDTVMHGSRNDYSNGIDPWMSVIADAQEKLLTKYVETPVYRPAFGLTPRFYQASRSALSEFSGTLSDYLDACELLGDGNLRYQQRVFSGIEKSEDNIAYIHDHFPTSSEMADLTPILGILSDCLSAARTFRNI